MIEIGFPYRNPTCFQEGVKKEIWDGGGNPKGIELNGKWNCKFTKDKRV